jgi:hypothetical protein
MLGSERNCVCVAVELVPLCVHVSLIVGPVTSTIFLSEPHPLLKNPPTPSFLSLKIMCVYKLGNVQYDTYAYATVQGGK